MASKRRIKEENVYHDYEGMYWGIVYIYINLKPGPQYGWVYIGITTNELERRTKWSRVNGKYAGRRINAARRQFGIGCFIYDVLARASRETVEELIAELERLERHYISIYDATRKGYNINGGGVGRPAVRVIVVDAAGNNTQYESLTAAGVALGLKEGSVRYWMGKNQPTKNGGYTIKTA